MRTDVKVGLICAFAVVLGAVIYFVMRSNAHPTPAMGADGTVAAHTPSGLDLAPERRESPAPAATPAPAVPHMDGLRIAAGPVGDPIAPPSSTQPTAGIPAPGSGGATGGLIPPPMVAGGAAGGIPAGGTRVEAPVTPSGTVDVIPPEHPLPSGTPSFGGGAGAPPSGGGLRGLGGLGGTGGATPTGTGAPTTYKVQKGDNFTTIAKKFNVSVAALQDANKGVDSSKLQINQTLSIPAAGTGIAAPKPATTRPAVTTRPAGGTPTASTHPSTSTPARHAGLTGGAVAAGAYEVVKGDTLTGIAKKYHVTLASLQTANPSIDPNHIKEGQTLKIPSTQ